MNMFPLLGHIIFVLWFCKKHFFSTNFLRIKVRLSNKKNMDSCNNLHSFYYWADIVLIGIYNTCALVSQEKLFSTIFLETKSLRQVRQTWIPIIISFFFVIGHHKHVLLIRIHSICAFVSQEKLFFFHHLSSNQSSSIKRDKQGFL